MKNLLISLINFYQSFLSCAFVGSCKYQVSCSQYTKQMVDKHGVYGLFLGIKRIWSCR